jgi:hypothetical protein
MREVAMNVFGDKRFWYAVAALIVVVIAVAIWSRSKTEGPATTSTPATTTEAPAKTSPPSPPETPPK